MELTARRRRALDAIADTFAPGGDGLPSATELGVPDALVETIRRYDARRLAPLLSLAAVVAFAGRSAAARERELLRWADSAVALRRAAFQSLRRGVLFHYFTLPHEATKALLGYPGPLGTDVPAPAAALRPLTDVPAVLTCDVCIVGSGAGGGVAAAVLAQAGLDVVVLEAGGYHPESTFDGDELSAYRRLYLDAGSTTTADGGFGLLAGACLGGGTVINYTTAFRTPDAVRDEWAAHGVPAFGTDEYTRSLDAVSARVSVNTDHSAPSSRDRLLRRGLEALGWHAGAIPRNVAGCDEGRVCGYCGFGCRLGAKQTAANTFLVDAQHAGARIVVDAPARRVVVENGAAVGVEARGVTVRARAVVVAAGALHTPALLLRSGLRNRSVGRWLRVHPVTAVVGEFDEAVRPWEGTLQAVYSDEHADLRDGYGVKFETAPEHPGLVAAFTPWRGWRPFLERVRRFPHTSHVGLLLRDRGSGTVKLDRDGEPLTRYRLDPFDLEHMQRGFAAAARVLQAAGATAIHAPHVSGLSWERRSGPLDGFLDDLGRAGWGVGHMTYYSFHLMGSVRMGGSPRDSACNEDGETWDVRNLVVADGSTFPTACGVNPMISIQAVAHMVATRLAARLA